MALENVNEKINNYDDKSEFKYRNKQIVVVSGLPRSGTSLMMQMLDKGGLTVLTDNNRKADTSNPKGYYEFDPVMSLAKDNSWLYQAQDKSVKIVAPLLKFLDPQYRYKVIFMNRDLTEIVKSQQTMIGKDPNALPTRLFNAYNKHLNQVDIWKNKAPNVELIYINHRDAINNTKSVISKVEKFVGKKLDLDAMLLCVDPTLYRNRN